MTPTYNLSMTLLFRYWGWGGEDDDFFARLKHQGLTPQLLSGERGRYKVGLQLPKLYYD